MYEDIKQEIIKFGHLAGVKGLTAGLSGNISCRMGENVIITSTSTPNGYLNSDDFTIIDINGNQISEGEKASSEKFLHLEFYKLRDDINCIFHVHSPYLTAFAAAGIALDKNILPEIVYAYDKIPIADYALPGSMELVKNTAKYFPNYDAVLMQNHGVIIGGKNLNDTFLKLELCETYAKTVIFAKILGGAKILSEEQVKEIYSLRK